LKVKAQPEVAREQALNHQCIRKRMPRSVLIKLEICGYFVFLFTNMARMHFKKI